MPLEGSGSEDKNLEILSEKDKFIFDMIYQRHIREFERLDSLDEKASKTILFVGIILGLVSTLVGIFMQDLGVQEDAYIVFMNSRLLLILGILLFAASIICSIKAYYVKTLDDVPETSHLISEYAKDESISCNSLLRTIGTEISNSIEDNVKIIDEKAQFVKYSLILFGIGMILVVLFVCGLLVN